MEHREIRVSAPPAGRHRARALTAAIVAVLMAAATAATAAEGSHAHHSAKPAASGSRHTGDRTETERFLGYEKAIVLTAEQEVVRKQALDALPAPCCAKFPATTCCCLCNMARATWGLAKHLIVERGADAATVRAEVAKWHRAINPDGFSGDACFTGGCGRAFAENGCGGMKENQLVF